MVEPVVRLNRKLRCKGTVISVYQDTAVANGNEAHWNFIHRDDAVAVIPVTEDGRILMVRQYCSALDRKTLGIPVGEVDDPKEPRIECACRGLEEETGSRTEELEFLTQVNTTVTFCDGGIDVFVAKNLIPSHQNLDDDEEIEVEAQELPDLLEIIYSGRMTDAKTVTATTTYAMKYGRQNVIIQKRANEMPNPKHSCLTWFIEFSKNR